MEKGEIFYNLRLDGLTNAQIGQRYGIKPHSVGSRISTWRKKYNKPKLPPPPGCTLKAARNGFSKVINDEKKLREANMKKAYRDEEGKLICPTMTCEGFGFDKKLDLER